MTESFGERAWRRVVEDNGACDPAESLNDALRDLVRERFKAARSRAKYIAYHDTSPMYWAGYAMAVDDCARALLGIPADGPSPLEGD